MNAADMVAVAAVFAAAVLLVPPRRRTVVAIDTLETLIARAGLRLGGVSNVVVVEVSHEHVGLHLVRADMPGDQRRLWLLPRPPEMTVERVVCAGGATFLEVGRSNTGAVLVNLDAIGTLAVTGAEPDVRRLVARLSQLLAQAGREIGVLEWDERPTTVPDGEAAVVGCQHAPVGAWPLQVRNGRLELPVLDMTLDTEVDVPTTVTVREPEPSQPMVHLLGPLELDAPCDGLTGRGRELVAYLASHRDGVTEERLRTVLWDSPPTRGTFNNLISSVRSSLGAIDGEPLLPRLGPDRRYRLAPTLTSDLERFAELAAVGEAVGALELVRGAVFDEGRLDWASLEGLAGSWERNVVDVAHRLARRCLTEGDIEGALWAADRGLLAAPGDEVLFRDRMLTWDTAGNPAAVESVMGELCAHLDGADPAEVLHPETLEVYRRCGRRHHLHVST